MENLHQVIIWVVLIFNPSTGEIKGGVQPLTFESASECTAAVNEYIRTTPAPPGTIAKGYCLEPSTDRATVVEPDAVKT